MYRTDKQFMKNPATADCRVYVGSLLKTVIAEDLEKIFHQYGKIMGLSLAPHGFAFIQYENSSEAQAAIKNENGKMLQGRKMVVKQAFAGSQQRNTPQIQQKEPQRQPNPPPKPALPPKQESPKQDPPPPLMQQQIPHKIEEEFQEESMDDDRPNIRPPGPPLQTEDKSRKGPRKDSGRGGGPGRIGRSNDRDRFNDRINDRFEPPPLMDNFREPFYGRDNRDFPIRNEPYNAPPPLIEPTPPVADKNDCEIIVVSKALTEFAEFIEQKLKNLGLIVDLLFPNEDVPIGKVLANISSRGCLYAIMVMPVNEEHGSLTLNVLHSIPEEHRNIPVDDAMILISRNFEAYMKGEPGKAEQTGQGSLLDRHPVPMQMLFNLLAENRQLTSSQYDRLIKYLQDRQEMQQKFELAEGITTDSQEGDSKQAELQNRIMSILNKPSDQVIPTSITAPDPPPPSEKAPILKDPTVQKALDSLMGDVFKNMGGA